MQTVKFYSGENVPLEMHKVRMVQNLSLPNIDERVDNIVSAGCNTFLLRNEDVFIDMLTDSGVNAMSDKQFAAMMEADDSYAGSRTFYKLEKALNTLFGTSIFLPAHQGRACENLIGKALIKPGQTVLMNYHFTTSRAHVVLNGGLVEELIYDEGLEPESSLPFKGDLDPEKLKNAFSRLSNDEIAFVRMEAGTNLIGGQPISLGNIEVVSKMCREKGVLLVLDASLLADNLYFMKTREEQCKNMSLNEITLKIGSLFDLIYFSARKLGCAKGGGICTSNEDIASRIRPLVPVYEGFLTYGGMSVREMEAITVGLYETLDLNVISQTPLFVAALTSELQAKAVPVVTPAGGMGCHVNAMKFCDHISQYEYQACALTAAMYVAGGIRAMERGTLSEERNPDGSEHLAKMELARLAIPKRTYTLSHIKYVADRIGWLYENRKLIGGLEFTEEPPIMRFFIGKLKPKAGWIEKLASKFKADFGDSL